MMPNNNDIENAQQDPAIYMMSGEEFRQIREEMQRLQERIRELEANNDLPLVVGEQEIAPEPEHNIWEEVPAPINNREPAPPQRHQEIEPGFARRAMFFMYNVGNAHAILRNFAWAVHDAGYVAGAVAGAATVMAQATPEIAMKMAMTANKAAIAVKAAAVANPVIAGVAAVVVAGAVVEKVTRYEDEEGKTRHHCAVM